MQIVIFILGTLCALVGLLLLFDKSSAKAGVACLFVCVALIILGSPLGERIRTLKVSPASVEATFDAATVPLTREQVEGAQKAQQIELVRPPAESVRQAATHSDWRAAIRRLNQERLDTLHKALSEKGFTAAPDPSMDLSPGAVVSIAQYGGVTLRFKRQDAFPHLEVLPLRPFDFVQFTSLGGTKTGFNVVGLFECEQGFTEDMKLSGPTPITKDADHALKQDPSLRVVSSVLGCYGRSIFVAAQGVPSPQRRYIFGFQLANVSVPDTAR